MSQPFKNVSLPKKPRILVIRRDNIGDLVCTTPLIRALREHCPDAKIAALVNSYNAPVLCGNPDLDKVFVYQKLKHANGLRAKMQAAWARVGLLFELRAWKPDVTILAKSGYDRHGLRFARQIGAKNIIGFLPEPGDGDDQPDIGINKSQIPPGHEVEEIGHLLNPLGFKSIFGRLRVYPSLPLVQRLKSKLPNHVQFIAMHISAREAERRWGSDNFITLIKQILQNWPEAQIMLLWSPGKSNDAMHPGDDEAAEIIIKEVNSDRLIPMSTKELPELIAALSLCDIFIGTDGGAMHLAAAQVKRIVALFENSPAKLNHWYPWQVPHKIVYGNEQEVRSIGVGSVKDALNIVCQKKGLG